jgi:hypothetical protein
MSWLPGSDDVEMDDERDAPSRKKAAAKANTSKKRRVDHDDDTGDEAPKQSEKKAKRGHPASPADADGSRAADGDNQARPVARRAPLKKTTVLAQLVYDISGCGSCALDTDHAAVAPVYGYKQAGKYSRSSQVAVARLYEDEDAEQPTLTSNSTRWYFGSMRNHFYLRIPDHMADIVGAQQNELYLFHMKAATDYSAKPEMQRLRWLSTVALSWLLIATRKTGPVKKKRNGVSVQVMEKLNKPVPVEVQAAYDHETNEYWITENDPKCAGMLSTGAWLTSLKDCKDQDGDNGHEELEKMGLRLFNRYNRHFRKLQETGLCDLAKVRFVAHDGTLPDAEAVDPHLDGKTVINVLVGSGAQHAETRLIDHFIRMKEKGYKKRKVTVAGVRRPCFVCYARLQVGARTLAANGSGWELHHKERPGPFWPTKAALMGIAKGSDEEQQIKDNLLQKLVMYVTGNEDLNEVSDEADSLREKAKMFDDLDSESDLDDEDRDDRPQRKPPPVAPQVAASDAGGTMVISDEDNA